MCLWCDTIDCMIENDAMHNTIWWVNIANIMLFVLQFASFHTIKEPILYNSLIISTYEIEKRKRVTIWLLLKFPGLPWFAVVSNNSFINAKINKMRCPTKEKLIFSYRADFSAVISMV